MTVEAIAYDVLVDRTDLGSGWTDESSTITDTATPTIERISIPLHELTAMPKASQRLLDDSAFDIEGWLAARIADRFARAEAAAFVTGDGTGKPKGFLDHPKLARTAGPGAASAMSRPARRGTSTPPTPPMQSSTSSMRWRRAIAPTRAS